MDEKEDSHLPCLYCGNDIMREQQAKGEMRYVGGETCAYVHAECLKRKRRRASLRCMN